MPTKGNPPKNAPVPHAPKGSLHEMALQSKAPTITTWTGTRRGRNHRRQGGRNQDTRRFVGLRRTPATIPTTQRSEFYDFADILLGLTTIFQTGGMTYLHLGRQDLAEGSKARVSFAPFYETDSDYDDGTNEDGQILWRKPNKKRRCCHRPFSHIGFQTPESFGELSKFGKIACLMNQDSLTNNTVFFGSQRTTVLLREKG